MLKAVAAHFVMYAEERVELMADQREVVSDLVVGVPGGTGGAPRPGSAA